METKQEIKEMIMNLHNVGEWMIEVVGGDPDDMDEHIKIMLDELGETIYYLESQMDKFE